MGILKLNSNQGFRYNIRVYFKFVTWLILSAYQVIEYKSKNSKDILLTYKSLPIDSLRREFENELSELSQV